MTVRLVAFNFFERELKNIHFHFVLLSMHICMLNDCQYPMLYHILSCLHVHCEHFHLISQGDDGELHIELTMPNAKKTLPEYYGFVSGRHSGRINRNMKRFRFFCFIFMELYEKE